MLSKVGDGAPVLFLHGFLGCKEDWDRIIFELKKEYACYSFDLPGHGNAPCSEDWEKDIFQHLDKEGISKLHVVGYSMGGRLAMRLIQKEPKRFAKKVFLSAHLGLTSSDEKNKRKEQTDKWALMIQSMPMEDFISYWYGQDLFVCLKENKELFKEVFQKRSTQNKEGLVHALRTMCPSLQGYFEMREECLFVFGEKDLKYQQLYTTLPSPARIASIKMSSHAVPIEKPEECSKIIKQFLGAL